MLTTALEVAGGWPVPVVLMTAGALLVVESGTLIGIVIPGTTVLVALGLWSHAAPQALGPGILVAAVATVTGAHVGWWRGRADVALGYSSAGMLGRAHQFAATRAAQAGRWLTERGPVATTVVLAGAHWASAARPAMPRVAGAAGIPYVRVGPVLIVSGSTWAATIVLLANRVGALVLTSAATVPIVVVVLVIGSLILHARWNRANSATSPDPRRSPQHQPCPVAAGEHLLAMTHQQDRRTLMQSGSPHAREQRRVTGEPITEDHPEARSDALQIRRRHRQRPGRRPGSR